MTDPPATFLAPAPRPGSDRPDSLPRTAALRWFTGAYLLVLGASFLILPRGPIDPLYGLVWMRGPLFVASGLAALWLCSLRLSRRATVAAHVLTGVPPLAVAVEYVHLGAYAPAVMLFLLGAAVALAPLAPARPPTAAWRPDILGIVLGLGLAAQGIDLLVQAQPPIVPYGLQSTIAVLFVVFGFAVACSHVPTRLPAAVRYAVHVGAGLSLLALCVILGVGVAPILWALNASGVLVAVALIGLPWWSARLAAVAGDTVRARLALGLFTGSALPLLIAVPIVLALRGGAEPAASSTRQAAFAVTLLLCLAASLVGWWLARYLVVPLARLVAGVERLAAGVRPVRLTADAPREVEELAAAVEAMAGRLDEQMREVQAARDQHKAVAERLQRALQVTTGEFPGVELAHVYQSASTGAEVGGDFYDVFHVSDARIGILIGDVSGKGLDAAAQAVFMRNSVRAFAYTTQSPAGALSLANELLLDTGAAGFVTAFLAVLDPVSGELTCSSAGHPPAILISACRAALLDGSNPLLGVFDDAAFTETRLHLDPGDTLLLYTDGLTEARCDGRLFGESQLMAAVQTLAALPPTRLTEELYGRALDFAGGILGDDLALLAVCLQPAPSEARAPTPAGTPAIPTWG